MLHTAQVYVDILDEKATASYKATPYVTQEVTPTMSRRASAPATAL